jgi:very-short-patch-repair endonuclease
VATVVIVKGKTDKRLQALVRKTQLDNALERIARESGHRAVKEHVFHPVRKWRFDVAFPDAKLAVEIDGGAWSKGRHVRGKGFIEDQRKTNAAAILGWRVLRFVWDDLENGSGYFVETILAALGCPISPRLRQLSALSYGAKS